MLATPFPALSARCEFSIAGMTCTACTLRVEKSLNALPAVQASANFANAMATAEFDPNRVSPTELVKVVEKSDYRVPRHDTELALEGMFCTVCAARIETILNALPGISAELNFASERALVRYDSGQTSVETRIETVGTAGYGALESTGASLQPERTRREQQYRHELHLFRISTALTLP
jgi:P-type Cu+ transporter